MLDYNLHSLEIFTQEDVFFKQMTARKANAILPFFIFRLQSDYKVTICKTC